ncbi:ABC transporter ATP-binding protein [Corynebacterium falsenii]|uniref:ABC transporter ATP-binding protein n=1 Tax=Corynebacterium falsenii TaxID=108486 RepID=UPI003FD1B332
MSRAYVTKKGLIPGTGKQFFAAADVNVTVHRGEVFGLLGTNGAGKTTTLEVLEGLNSPTEGSVEILGRDPLKDRAAVRPEMGIMLQSGGLPRELTVTETLTMWRGTCTHPRSVDEVLRDVDLLHRADVRVGSLSGGEQRRLDLACALVGNPQLLFLDEPTTGLDPESRHRTWELLRSLKQDGLTMIITTHYMEEAEALCDRIAIMDAGRIHVSGTVAELKRSVPAQITFECKPEELNRLVQGLQGNGIVRNGCRVEISTTTLQEDAFTVLSNARNHRIAMQNFAAQPASLDQVFMQIAGGNHVAQQAS